jgi:aldose 1-epimerase
VEFVMIEAQAERAVLVPEAGCQCMSYTVGGLDVIAGPSSPDEWRSHPFRSGIPILFPWPGRIADGRLSFGGVDLELPLNEPARHNSIHGLVWNCPFTVVRRGPYHLTALLDSRSNAELSRLWPFPFVLEVAYEIGGGLRISARIRNTGKAAMPFGFGAHPYFRAPLGPSGSRAAMTIQIASAGGRWPMDDRILPAGAPVVLTGKFDLRTARAIGADSYDDVFQLDLRRDPDAACARLVDPAAKLALEIRADAAFGQLVVFAPPDSGVVAIEPYTCAPDAFNLSAHGIDSGARELAPGESFGAGFEIRLGAP